MTLPAWGGLSKSADDPSTIDDAIAAAIAAHDADVVSHTQDGASLDIHRTNDVLDHPQSSVLGDKQTSSEIVLHTQFDNSASFGSHGTPVFSFPGFQLAPTSTTFSNRKEVYFDGEDQGFVLNFATDFLFQFSFSPDTFNNHTFIAQLGDYFGDATERGVGLEIINGVAQFYVAKLDGTSKSYLSWPSYADALQYVVRMQYDHLTATVSVYINGNLLGTLTYPDTSQSDILVADFYQIKNSSGAGQSSVYDMYLVLVPNS